MKFATNSPTYIELMAAKKERESRPPKPIKIDPALKKYFKKVERQRKMYEELVKKEMIRRRILRVASYLRKTKWTVEDNFKLRLLQQVILV